MVPTERISELSPTAAPASLSGRRHDQGRHRRVADPDAGGSLSSQATQLPRRTHQQGRDDVAGAEHAPRRASGCASRRCCPPAGSRRARRQHHQATRRHPQAGAEDRLPEAVSGRRRQLQQLRPTIACAIMPKPIVDAARLVSSTARPGGGAQIDHRIGCGAARTSPTESRTTMPPAIAPSVRPTSTPRRCPWRSTRARPGRLARPTCTDEIEAARRARRARAAPGRQRRRHHTASPRGDQNSPCQLTLRDPGRQRQADRAAHAEGRAHRRDRRWSAIVRRRDLAHEADADGNEAHREALKAAADDHRRSDRQRANQRTDHQHRPRCRETRCLPYMSPSRPETGIATAAPSSVER